MTDSDRKIIAGQVLAESTSTREKVRKLIAEQFGDGNVGSTNMKIDDVGFAKKSDQALTEVINHMMNIIR